MPPNLKKKNCATLFSHSRMLHIMNCTFYIVQCAMVQFCRITQNIKAYEIVHIKLNGKNIKKQKKWQDTSLTKIK